jgi:large subunit ribosomal protein L10
MAKSRQQKESDLQDLEDNLLKAQTVVIFENPGFSFPEQEEIRREARKMGGRIKVYKNSIMSMAYKNQDMEEMDFTGMTICAFDFEDQMGLLKFLYNKSKEKDAKKFKFIGGIFEGRVVGALDIESYASLPSKDELLSKLSYLINYGSTGIARSVNGVSQKLVGTLNSYKEKLENN